jgi:hypothetical protein
MALSVGICGTRVSLAPATHNDDGEADVIADITSGIASCASYRIAAFAFAAMSGLTL